jgi:hypothetical protein
MSKIEISFDVSKIEEIQVRNIRDSSYKWFPEVKEERGWFGCIKQEYISAGWSDYEDGRIRRTTKELESYGYLIDQLGKKAWHKAYVEVSLGYKNSIGRSFDSNSDALKWAEFLRVKSKKTFEIFYV